MTGKILRRCDICGKFHASYLVEDEKLGKLKLCYSCWQARAKQQGQPPPPEKKQR